MSGRTARRAVAVVCLAAMLLLCGCSGNPADSTEHTTPQETSSEKPADTSAPVSVVDLSDYTIVRSDKSEQEFTDYVTDWRVAMNKKLGITLKIKTDWSKDVKNDGVLESGPEVHELLVGDTNRAESRAVAEQCKFSFGYVIKFTNGKLVVWGTDMNATIKGLEYLLEYAGSEPIKSDMLYEADLSGEGSSIWRLATQYKIICGKNTFDREVKAAQTLKSGISELSGAVVSMGTVGAERTDKEILVGNTGLDESNAVIDKLDYMDYSIVAQGSKLIVAGGSPLATEQAVNTLLNQLKTGKLEKIEGFEYNYRFRDVRPDSVIWNTSAFVPVWASEFTPPEWLVDFEQKAYGCVYSGGRMMGDAHRGDNANYPENSAEGILSAVLMGADCIEIDIRLTADNVMVLMHDETLKRTTDFASKKGKNGLPTSEKVSDWTYEQLLQLNLKSGRGGSSASVTKYKICTAYEAIAVIAGHCMVHWDCKDDRIIRNTDTYTLAAELNAKQNFYYYYGPEVLNEWYNLDKSDKDFGDFLDRMAAYCRVTGGTRRNRNFDFIAKYGDDLEAWNTHVKFGYSMVFTNKIYDLCRHVAANCEPFEIKK